MALIVAIACALVFSWSNGFLDAASTVATLITTRGARPRRAIGLSALFKVLGALLVGTAVASTIAGIVTVSPSDTVAVLGSAALAATLWNAVTWWRSLPSSSGHALLGGLTGAALAQSGTGAVHWGGVHGLVGTLVVLAISPPVGLVLGVLAVRSVRLLLRRATRRAQAPVLAGEWGMSAALSFGSGANDGQKSMGLIVTMLLATGHLQAFAVPLWVKLLSAGALTVGTSMGSWRIIGTLGRRIVHLAPIDGFASESASAAVILAASLAGAPVSTTQVVASSVLGVGTGRRRWMHIRWAVVRSMAFAWIVTLPAAAALGAVTLAAWTAIA